MSIRLIINSDDYCRTSPISRGIREAHLDGVLTSTTCMMNFPNAADDVALALRETPDLGLGVHLVLTSGPPILAPEEIPTLVTAENRFPNLSQFMAYMAEVDPTQVKMEWQAQIEKFVRLTGQNPTHLDSHHHSSYYTEPFFRAMLELAQEYQCAIRQINSQDSDYLSGLPWEVEPNVKNFAPALRAEFNIPTTDTFYASFYDDHATKENLLGTLKTLKDGGIYEVMCHPGYSDAALEASSTYNRQRESELAILIDNDIQATIDRLGIEQVTFAALQN